MTSLANLAFRQIQRKRQASDSWYMLLQRQRFGSNCFRAFHSSFFASNMGRVPSLIVSATAALTTVVGSNALSLTMPSLNSMKEHIPLAKKAMEYFDISPDPYHVAEASTDMLKQAGFQELTNELRYAGNITPGGKYFFTRNKTTIVAFTVGEKYKAGNGFKIIGGHTDSPNLKVKPRSKRTSSGWKQIAVECYGGGLWHTWFDRDLGISGRVLVRNKNSEKIEQKLVKIDRAVLRIPNLAIHLTTAEERAAFKVNKEDHLVPLLATAVEKSLNGGKESDSDTDKDGWKEYQEPLLLQILADELSVSIEDIADFELNLFDVQPAALGGAYSELIFSARLDNLATCFMALRALIDHADEELASDEDISLIALFDHEEVGSESSTGAGSPIMIDAVRQIASALNSGNGNQDLYSLTINKSFVVSSDQAHAIHPNYASKHEKGHAPKTNEGMVIKRNSNQRYATNSVTGFLLREVAKKAGLPPLQEFVVRNDCGCGSTIGPIISSVTGIRAIDVGCPQLSMHSIRETMGVKDLTNGVNLFKAFFKHFRDVDNSLEQ